MLLVRINTNSNLTASAYTSFVKNLLTQKIQELLTHNKISRISHSLYHELLDGYNIDIIINRAKNNSNIINNERAKNRRLQKGECDIAVYALHETLQITKTQHIYTPCFVSYGISGYVWLSKKYPSFFTSAPGTKVTITSPYVKYWIRSKRHDLQLLEMYDTDLETVTQQINNNKIENIILPKINLTTLKHTNQKFSQFHTEDISTDALTPETGQGCLCIKKRKRHPSEYDEQLEELLSNINDENMEMKALAETQFLNTVKKADPTALIGVHASCQKSSQQLILEGKIISKKIKHYSPNVKCSSSVFHPEDAKAIGKKAGEIILQSTKQKKFSTTKYKTTQK
jgi:porphobilinogen deaminase